MREFATGRKTHRLKGYDYSLSGRYFITICTHERRCFFGEITDGEMKLNELGKKAEECLHSISAHFHNIQVAENVIMPNHLHFILVITKGKEIEKGENTETRDVRTRNFVSLQTHDNDIVGTSNLMSDYHGTPHLKSNTNRFSSPVPGSVSVVVQQFKAAVRRWSNKNGQSDFQWQSRFHEHIIRTSQSYLEISRYIKNNPKLWKDDVFFQK